MCSFEKINNALNDFERYLIIGDSDSAIELLTSVPGLKNHGCGDRSVLTLARDSSLQVLQVILRSGVNVDISDSFGGTLLMYYSGRGDVSMVNELLNLGADPNLATNGSETAISYACVEDHLDVAKILFQFGADLNAKIGESTPLDWAIRFASDGLVEWLRNSGARSTGTHIGDHDTTRGSGQSYI